MKKVVYFVLFVVLSSVIYPQELEKGYVVYDNSFAACYSYGNTYKIIDSVKPGSIIPNTQEKIVASFTNSSDKKISAGHVVLTSGKKRAFIHYSGYNITSFCNEVESTSVHIYQRSNSSFGFIYGVIQKGDHSSVMVWSNSINKQFVKLESGEMVKSARFWRCWNRIAEIELPKDFANIQILDNDHLASSNGARHHIVFSSKYKNTLSKFLIKYDKRSIFTLFKEKKDQPSITKTDVKIMNMTEPNHTTILKESVMNNSGATWSKFTCN